ASPFVPLPAGQAFGNEPPLITPRRRSSGLPVVVHLLPALLLMFALLGVLVADFFKPSSGVFDDGVIDPNPKIAIQFEDKDHGSKAMRFGVLAVDSKKNPKLLTFGPFGHTNSTVLRVDNVGLVFGFRNGNWEKMQEKDGKATRSIWVSDNGIRVTQT